VGREKVDMSEHVRLFVSFPEELVDRPMIYEVVKRFDVVPNIRRANVEQHSGWVILELIGAQEQLDRSIASLEEVGCTVNTMEGDVIEG
jgi:ABC-type methionine transport system ATPase subunit